MKRPKQILHSVHHFEVKAKLEVSLGARDHIDLLVVGSLCANLARPNPKGVGWWTG